MSIINDDPWLTRQEAAKYTRFKPGTLAVWASTNRYNLKVHRVGRSVRYKKSDLDRLLNQFYLGAVASGS